ncbi:MAG: dipeptide-binding transporter [Actinomycetia bacterium]|nr:dipeptide-binding transporter [Actinomycetes bacterium]
MTKTKLRRVLVLVVGGALVLSACGSSDSSSEAAPTKPSSDFDPNGSLTAVLVQAPSTLDPAKPVNTGPWPYMSSIYDRLVGRDDDNKLLPMVATSWSFSSDGKTFTMKLRKDVKFNDGTPLTSADVKASIERAQTITGSAWVKALSAIASIDTPGPYQVQFNLSRPSGGLPALFATPAGSVINAKAIASGEDLATNPGPDAGSGPMIVKSIVLNSRVDYVRADNDYWDPDANRLAKMSLQRVPESVARLNALRSGQADVATIKLETSKQAKALAKQGAFVYKEKPNSQVNTVFMSRTGTLSDVRVRQALNYAIDRKAMEAATGGDCQATSQVFTRGAVGFDGSLDHTFDRDVAKAKKLLADAGHPNGLTVSLSVPQGAQPYEFLAPIMQQQMADAGIKLEVRVKDPVSYTQQFLAGQDDMMFATIQNYVDPGLMLDLFYFGGQQIAKGIDDITTLAAEGQDRTQPTKVWQQKYVDISRITQDQALVMPTCSSKAQYLMTKKVGGFDKMPGQLESAAFEGRVLWKTK